MSAALPFITAHISALAARAAELEQIGEETQDPAALIRAARLYILAVRVADDIDNREALPFLQSDLARVRDELRTLAAHAAATAVPDRHGSGATDTIGEITRRFREIALRIEQRLASDESRQISG
jgi:hypothetical protein